MKRRVLYLVALPLLESARKIAFYTMLGAFALLFVGYLPEGQDYTGLIGSGVLSNAFVAAVAFYAVSGVFVSALASGRADFSMSGSASASGGNTSIGRGSR